MFFIFFSGMINAQTKKIGFLTDITVVGTKLNSSGYNFGLLTISPYYKLNNNLSLGFGTGLLVLGDRDITGFPLYGYGQWDFSSVKNINPFISSKIGYSIISKNEQYTHIEWDESEIIEGVQVDRSFRGGFLASLSIGFLYYIRNNRAFSFALTPKLQKMTVKDNTRKDLNSKRNLDNITLSLDVGFRF